MCFAFPLCNFFTYLGLNSSAYTQRINQKCEICGNGRHLEKRNVIGLLFVRVTIRNTLVALSCSCLRVEGVLRMSNFCFLSC